MTSIGVCCANWSAKSVFPLAVGPAMTRRGRSGIATGPSRYHGRRPSPHAGPLVRMTPAQSGDAPAAVSAPPYSNLQAVLDSGEFAVTCELGPPRAPDAADVRKKVGIIRGYVDAASCTDNQGAALKMANWGAALLCLQCGVEPIMQLSCRDRNRLAIQSDVIAAQAFGVRNFMSISGDSLVLGDHPMAKPVFDLQGVATGAPAASTARRGPNGRRRPDCGRFWLLHWWGGQSVRAAVRLASAAPAQEGGGGSGICPDADDLQRGSVRGLDVVRARRGSGRARTHLRGGGSAEVSPHGRVHEIQDRRHGGPRRGGGSACARRRSRAPKA